MRMCELSSLFESKFDAHARSLLRLHFAIIQQPREASFLVPLAQFCPAAMMSTGYEVSNTATEACVVLVCTDMLSHLETATQIRGHSSDGSAVRTAPSS